MGSLESFVALARSLDAGGFAERCAHAFLVKRPRDAHAPEARAIGFRTALVRAKPRAELLEGEAFARALIVEPVAKRPGNPFPERISVGRATNCDIVLRVAYVSKLHAHILVEPGLPMRLVDLRSANGTRVNGLELPPGEARELAIGDVICFGAAEMELLDSRRVHALLRGARSA